MAVKCDSRYPTSSKTESIGVTNATLYLEYIHLEILAVSQLSGAFHSVLTSSFSCGRVCTWYLKVDQGLTHKMLQRQAALFPTDFLYTSCYVIFIVAQCIL
jgi:hypothetical protein